MLFHRTNRWGAFPRSGTAFSASYDAGAAGWSAWKRAAVRDRRKWNEQYAWLIERLEDFDRVFRSRLNLLTSTPERSGPDEPGSSVGIRLRRDSPE